MRLIQLSLAPFQGDLWEALSPGLKPRAESSCPFGVENPLRNLKLMRMSGGPDLYRKRGRATASAGAALSAIGYYEALSKGI